MLADIKRRVMGSIARAMITHITDGTVQMGKIRVLVDEDLEDVERLQNYGFTSWPDDGAQGLVVFCGGNREHGVILSADHPLARKKLAKGEAAFYTKFDTWVHLKADETVDFKSKNFTLTGDGFASVTEKVSFENAAGDELIDLLVQVTTELSNIAAALVPVTGIAAPAKATAIANLAALQTKLTSFKV